MVACVCLLLGLRGVESVFTPVTESSLKLGKYYCLKEMHSGACSTFAGTTPETGQGSGTHGAINEWDVSQITSMRQLFWGALQFNHPIASWDVSSVTDMGEMFKETRSFNQPLSSWDVSQVKDMNHMFAGQHADRTCFNRALSTWDVSAC